MQPEPTSQTADKAPIPTVYRKRAEIRTVIAGAYAGFGSRPIGQTPQSSGEVP